MTPGARIQGAIELLNSIAEVSAPADRASAAFFRARRYIGAKDRREILDHTYDCLRTQARLTWHLGTKQPSARLLMIAKLLLIDRWSTDRLSGSFDGGQYRPEMLNKEERQIAKRIEGKDLSPPDQPDEVALEIPKWLLPGLKKALGTDWYQEIEALRDDAPTDLRVNKLKGERAEVQKKLADLGIETAPTLFSPLGLRLHTRVNLPRLDVFQHGVIEVQDEGSQLVALLLGTKPGERVVDFCAGAGGKTLAMAAEMQNKGKIIAADVLAGRLERSSTRLARAGVYNVERKALTSEKDPWVKRHAGDYDRVLVDAPCSGTGTWRRNPDQKWRLMPEDLPRLVELQANILESAQRLVKPGGHLLYATCSLLPEENEGHLPDFLAAHPEFSLADMTQSWRDMIGTEPPFEGPWMRLTPKNHHCDGFFAALLRRSPFVMRRAKISDAGAIAEIHEAGWRLAYEGIASAAQLDGMQAEKRVPFWQEMISSGEDFVFLALENNQPVGFVHGGKVKPHDIKEGSLDGFDAEIYSLHCRKKVHGRGLGKQMLRHALAEMQKAGRTSLMLWAFRDNRFRAFYEKIGGTKIASGMDDGIPDIAYGWKDGTKLHAA